MNAPTLPTFVGIICGTCGYRFDPSVHEWHCPYCRTNYGGGWVEPRAYHVMRPDDAFTCQSNGNACVFCKKEAARERTARRERRSA